MEKTTLQINVVYTPYAKDGFTETKAHYTATRAIPEEMTSGTIYGHSEYSEEDAARALIELWRKANQTPEVRESFFNEPEYEIVSRTNYPEDVLAKINAQIETAKKEQEEQKLQEKQFEDLVSRAKQELGEILYKRIYIRKGWSTLKAYHPKTIEVAGVSRYDNRRDRTVIRQKTFKPNPRGEFNWLKIRSAAQEVQDYADRREQTANVIETRRTANGAIRKSLTEKYNLPEYSSNPFNVDYTDGHLRFVMQIESEEQASKILDALNAVGISFAKKEETPATAQAPVTS